MAVPSKKSFIETLSNSLMDQMTPEIWEKFDSQVEAQGKLSVLLRDTNVLNDIQEQTNLEFERYRNDGNAYWDTNNGNGLDIFTRIQNGSNFQKSRTKATQIKEVGNQRFCSGDNENALDLYTCAIGFSEPDDKKDLSILYANRSAALFHLKNFDLCQRDISIAFELGYPLELQPKLYERSGRCFLEIGKSREAERVFLQGLRSLSHTSMTMESDKKQKVKGSLEKLLNSVTKNSKGFSFNYKSKSIEDHTEDSSSSKSNSIPEIFAGRGKYLENTSTKLSLMRNKKEGRHVIANENISPGEIILVEKAYVSTLTTEAYRSQCFQCYSMLRAPVPCSTCALVYFCSTDCRDKAMSTHHQYECDILEILCLARVSITCLMALRVLTQNGLAEIKKWSRILQCTAMDDVENASEVQINNSSRNSIIEENLKFRQKQSDEFRFKEAYDPTHISCLFKLVTHSGHRTPTDYFRRSIMTLFLILLLKRTKFFGDKKNPESLKATRPLNLKQEEKNQDSGESFSKTKDEGNDVQGMWNNDDDELGENETEQLLLLGSILLRILEALHFNAHEIAAWDSDAVKSVFIGGGLFPSLAFFNHSCNPSIIRYFINDTVIVRTVRTIYRGEAVTENYGPIFTESSRSERQTYLKSRYWFDCDCQPCKDNWPTFNNLNQDPLNFRCQNCRRFLCKSTEESFGSILRCNKCLKPTNIFGSLKSLEKSEQKYQEALEFINNCKLEQGEKILLENMKLFDSILIPPFQDYHLCQEGLRKCYLPLGNECKSFKIQSKWDGIGVGRNSKCLE